ncbi:prepilin-type N-terminal cleavage/methylation domain-containing protein [bacterium]|nr:prepilin-type N-terminal cleavage/methylation domain-containing protein [bacterium]
MNNKNNKKCAFTLAEVLITLGIIGVVAAMSIPTLLASIDKKSTVSKLQRSIAVINQAQQLSDEGTGGISPTEAITLGSKKYFDTYWAPYIKAVTFCDTYARCGYSSNTPFLSSNGKKASSALQIVHNSRIAFYTPDGFLYLVTNARYTGGNKVKENSANVVVDINGSQGPNRFGRDVFVLVRLTEGKGIVPLGLELSDTEVKKGCSKQNQNEPVSKGYCAEWIRRSGWKIPKDYPW